MLSLSGLPIYVAASHHAPFSELGDFESVREQAMEPKFAQVIHATPA
jgi:hypothetical protein